MHRRLLVPCLAVLAATACGGSMSIGDQMFDQFGRAGHVHTALIMGDLDRARAPAAWLADHDGFPGMGSTSDRWVAEIRDASSAVAEAQSIDAAANATGRLGAACAGCHAESGGGPRYSYAADGQAEGSHMVRHTLALERMWLGLLGPDDEMWERGALAIGTESPDEVFSRGSTTAAIANSVHEQAARAARAPADERAAAYAEMIKGCAGCHTLVGAGAR